MIGVFDSGIGGLSVALEIRRQAASVDIVYVADAAYAPYGERPRSEVVERSLAISRHLVADGADPVVIACNTASGVALETLRATIPTAHFVGMEPAVKPAIGASPTGTVAVLATSTTFDGDLFTRLAQRFSGHGTIIPVACTGLAEAIDRGTSAPGKIEAMVARFLQPALDAGADTFVLGCTHYPWVIEEIRHVVGPDALIIDPAPAVARESLRHHPTSGGKGRLRILTTGDPGELARRIRTVAALETEPVGVVIGPALAPR